MKKRMYVVTNLDGDQIYYDNIDDALGSIKIDIEESSDEDIEDAEFTFTTKLMTEEEIAALPEYTG